MNMNWLKEKYAEVSNIENRVQLLVGVKTMKGLVITWHDWPYPFTLIIGVGQVRLSIGFGKRVYGHFRK